MQVQELLDQAIARNNQVKSGERNAAYFHVSDAGKCYRYRYYKRLGVEALRLIEPAGLRKMVAGDAGHWMIQRLLGPYLFAHEKPVGDGKHILGHFDGLIKEGGSKALLEIKTIEKWGMTYITKDGPKPEHELQLFTYWLYLRQDYKDLDNAILSYVKREDFEARDFTYTWDALVSARVAAEWEPLLSYWQRRELPPCTCNTMYYDKKTQTYKGPRYCIFATSETECCGENLMTEALYGTAAV